MTKVAESFGNCNLQGLHAVKIKQSFIQIYEYEKKIENDVDAHAVNTTNYLLSSYTKQEQVRSMGEQEELEESKGGSIYDSVYVNIGKC